MKTINKESPKLSYRRDVNSRQLINHYLLAIEKLRHVILTLPYRLQNARNEQALEKVTQ